MKPYSAPTDKGRTVAEGDVHHRTADQPRPHAKAAAKSLRKGARQHGRRLVREVIE